MKIETKKIKRMGTLLKLLEKRKLNDKEFKELGTLSSYFLAVSTIQKYIN